ncbi:hypothetical protein [Pectobacterium odoriferum]|nr:hypothetical protein [Pectobacterium odoriferum]
MTDPLVRHLAGRHDVVVVGFDGSRTGGIVACSLALGPTPPNSWMTP